MAENNAESAQCPTCGPTRLEDHPREWMVERCCNCKEWLRFNGQPFLTSDGMANNCTHGSATGIDTTPLSDPGKVWRCDHCGLRWRADGERVPSDRITFGSPDNITCPGPSEEARRG